MSAASDPRAGRPRPVGHTLLPGAMRFAAELVAWVATPWALWSTSIPLAVLSVVVLIALPSVFGTPGDRPGGDAPVAAPGIVTILIVVVTLAAGVVSAWITWPTWVAVVVTVLCVGVVVTEQPRWRALVARR